MVEQRSQSRETLATTSAGLVGAVVEGSLMSGAADMLLKALGAAELVVADVTLVAMTIVGRSGVPSRVDGIAVVPFEQAFSDDAVGITLTKSTMDDAVGQILGFGTGRGFQVVRKAGSRNEGSLAE